MSQENVEIVQRFYRAWARNDLPGLVDLMVRTIEYVNPSGPWSRNTTRPHRVQQSRRKGLRRLETWQIEPERLPPWEITSRW